MSIKCIGFLDMPTDGDSPRWNRISTLGKRFEGGGGTFTVTRKNTSLETFRGPASCKFHHKNNNKHHNTQGKPFAVKAENRESFTPKCFAVYGIL